MEGRIALTGVRKRSRVLPTRLRPGSPFYSLMTSTVPTATDDMDRLASQLDAAHEAASEQISASVRPADAAEVVRLPVGRRKSAPKQGVSSWGGEDSNLRPTDYESGSGKALTCTNS